MSANAPILTFPTRVSRFAVSLPCQIGIDDVNFEGTVVNVSHAGLGIELDTVMDQIDLTSPYFVVVDGLGEFNVDIRWKRGDRIGVKFCDKNDSKVRIQQYLDTDEIAPA